MECTSVVDGLGLTIYIKNIGDETVHNIILQTEVIEGSPWVVLKKHITIPSLAPGESTDIHMNLFGFSIGIFAPFSMITLSLHAPDIIPFEWGIITMIIGLSIRILGTYFNSPFSSYPAGAPRQSRGQGGRSDAANDDRATSPIEGRSPPD